MGETCSTHSRDEICLQNCGQETWRKPLWRRRYRWEYNVNINLKGIGWGGCRLDSIRLG